MMRRNFCAGVALFTAAMVGFAAVPALADDASAPAPVYTLPAGTPQYIRAAIEDPARTPEQRARDYNRKPAELLMLSGIRPGNTVVEFASFGQYFTSFLSDIVGPKGAVYMYDLPYTDKRAGDASRAFVAAHPTRTTSWWVYNTWRCRRTWMEVFMVLYYHDLFINKIDTASLDARIFKALKPGGVFFVVDHNATPGGDTLETATKLHRIDPAVIQKEVTAAGFRLDKVSKLLAHPADDHTQIVFSPALRGAYRSDGVRIPQAQGVDAGDFGAWLTQAREALRGTAGSAVPCGDCTGCCTSAYSIEVRPTDAAALEQIPAKSLFRSLGSAARNWTMRPDGGRHLSDAQWRQVPHLRPTPADLPGLRLPRVCGRRYRRRR